MTAALMTAPSWRYVTDAEQALAREVFGSALAAARVRVFCLPLVILPFTPGSWGTVWPRGWGLEAFTEGPPARQGDFIHELTHVWQAQTGTNLALAKLRARNDYDYLPLGPDRFAEMNIEQQAAFVEHAFLAERGWGGLRPASYYAPARRHWYRP